MRVLDRKLLRDLRRAWAQALAMALVIAGGSATLLMAVGAYRTLDETRIAYYERNRFADVFASVRRAPNAVAAAIAEIPGVAAVETRIAKLALLDIPDVAEPATAQFISVPQGGEPSLNRLVLRSGRMPALGRDEEVVVNEAFAKAHGFSPESRFRAILNGRKRDLTVVGTALSPEFIYAIGPGDIMPDDRRFAIVWMSEDALEAAYDLEGAFSSVTLKLSRGASEREVIRRLDALLEGYGGSAAYGRKDQTSDAFVDHELDMLGNMSRTLPPIFLLVAAFLVNLVLTRMIALEREQIGLLKAIGYGRLAIASHYVKFVLCIALVGMAIGSIAGTWLGSFVANLFGDFFRFPYLVFIRSPDLYVLGAALSIAAALIGAGRAVRDIVSLPPAVAIQPPAPARFRRLFPGRGGPSAILSQRSVMMMRIITHHPVRALLTTGGMALATAILVVSLFTSGTMEHLIDVTYFLADRQDATLSFFDKRPQAVVHEAARLPGVLRAEAYREIPVRIRSGSVERRIMITGRPRDADLSRVIDIDLRPVALPEGGLAISQMLGEILRVRPGDLVEIDLLDGERRTVRLPVAALVEDYFGIKGMMDADAVSRLLREAPAADGVHLAVDPSSLHGLYDWVKRTPLVSGLALQRASLTNFRASLALLVTTMASIYTALAAIIAFGIIYNSARVSLSERARDLASLRVLGFTRGEVLRMLLLELALLTVLAQPPGWAAGYGLAWVMKENLAGELMRVRLVVEHSTYVLASAIVLTAAMFSALVVARRVSRLDLVAVLKTRD
ncbi:MAG: peptide transporter permease [Rhodospirillales bacterium]|nr:peptide transporter permease [Rhodospirillales bacterium]